MCSSQSVHQAPKPVTELLRATDIRLVIHMDNMLVMAHSNQMFREHVYQGADIVREPWIHHQQQEISAISYSRDRVSWNDCELSDYRDQATRTEDQINQAGNSHDPRSPTAYSSTDVPASRETECH